MEKFEGKVAVITGAASGIGRGLARVFARTGMRLVLADIEEEALREAEQELCSAGADVLPVLTDVADRASVFALAEAAYGRHGSVHVLCNNAGVGGATGGGPGVWNAPPESWQWMLGVNLMGVVHGLQAFVPRMLERGEEGHIVNTSSVMGVWTGPGSIYSVSKHAVTALTEGLYHDLRSRQARVGVTLLLPGLVGTRINTGGRNRPQHLRSVATELSPETQHRMEEMDRRYQRDGMPPEQVGEIVLEAIRQGRLYAFTHPGSDRRVAERMRAILEGAEPPLPPQGVQLTGRE